MLTWLRDYRPGWLRPDLLAGLTVWAVLVPESLAYATIAGVPPVVGLYAAVPALVLYAFFGSSRHLVVGPMAATAALSASIVAVYAQSGGDHYVALTTALALITGIIAILAGLLRLGFLAGFISEPVLKGFIVGLALTIIAGQIPKLFGVPKGVGDFFQQIWHFFTHIGETNGWALAIGAVCLCVVVALKRWLPGVPGSLMPSCWASPPSPCSASTAKVSPSSVTSTPGCLLSACPTSPAPIGSSSSVPLWASS